MNGEKTEPVEAREPMKIPGSGVCRFACPGCGTRLAVDPRLQTWDDAYFEITVEGDAKS
jgi:hypothetical protein